MPDTLIDTYYTAEHFSGFIILVVMYICSKIDYKNTCYILHRGD